jgi:hypothetical protein
MVLLASATLARGGEREIAVIAHPSRQEAVGVSDLRRLFMRQRRFWSDGSAVIAVNQRAATPIRTDFERTVFGAEAATLPAYWNRQYFDGLFPPITLDSDAAVQRYVAAKPNAIGYVDADAVDGSVRVVLRLPADTRREP